MTGQQGTGTGMGRRGSGSELGPRRGTAEKWGRATGARVGGLGGGGTGVEELVFSNGQA